MTNLTATVNSVGHIVLRWTAPDDGTPRRSAPPHRLPQEVGGAPGGVGAALAQTGHQHLAGAGGGREQRVIASLASVAMVSRPLLGHAVGLSFAYLLPRARNDTNRKPLNREICNFLREKTMTAKTTVHHDPSDSRARLPNWIAVLLIAVSMIFIGSALTGPAQAQGGHGGIPSITLDSNQPGATRHHLGNP